MNRSSKGLRFAAAALAVAAVAALPTARAADHSQIGGRPGEMTVRPIRFPVVGGAAYSDDWADPRSGGRRHQGNDLFAAKHTPLRAVADGVIAWARGTDSGLAGRMLALTTRDGWTYYYIHLNNDTPGTDDGAAPDRYTFPRGIESGVSVEGGQVIAYLGDSGNAEGTAPHLHFEVHTPWGDTVNPWPSLRLSQGRRVGNLCRFDSTPTPPTSDEAGEGLWALNGDGAVFRLGNAGAHGSVAAMRRRGERVTGSAIVDVAAHPDGGGYWLLSRRGHVYAFGTADELGSVAALRRRGVVKDDSPAVEMAPTPSGDGYWVLTRNGGVRAFGDAEFLGSLRQRRRAGVVNNDSPAVALAAASERGDGYWIANRKGQVFAFGAAQQMGSPAALRREGRDVSDAPVTGMAARPDGRGYWVLNRHGDVFAFGALRHWGSVSGLGLCGGWGAVVDITPAGNGRGYWLQGRRGRVFAFGQARNLGSLDVMGKSEGVPLTAVAVAP